MIHSVIYKKDSQNIKEVNWAYCGLFWLEWRVGCRWWCWRSQILQVSEPAHSLCKRTQNQSVIFWKKALKTTNHYLGFGVSDFHFFSFFISIVLSHLILFKMIIWFSQLIQYNADVCVHNIENTEPLTSLSHAVSPFDFLKGENWGSSHSGHSILIVWTNQRNI